MKRKFKFYEKNGVIAPVKIGWSWSVFIFSEWALIFRGQILSALTSIIISFIFEYVLQTNNISLFHPLSGLTLLLVRIVYSFNANDWLEKKLITKGFKLMEN